MAIVALTAPAWLSLLLGALLGTAVTLGWPVFFTQRRMGLGCRPFVIYKVRTMRSQRAAPEGALFEGWTYANDPRVTRFGAWLRRYRLDELPQLWNVLRGDMSLVGPRPEPYEIALRLGRELEGYDERHRVLPGLTGLCQISPVYRDFGTIEKSAAKLALDLEYVRTGGLRRYGAILWRTFAVVARGQGMA